MADNVTERDWQREVVAWAKRNGWTPVHFPNVVQARANGWPDLVLIRVPEILVAELKREGGRLTTAQESMVRKLLACGLEVHVWYPHNRETVYSRLQRNGGPAQWPA